MTDDTVTQLDRKRPRPHSYWTEPRIRRAAKRFGSIGAFRKGEPGAFEAAERKGIAASLGLRRLVSLPKTDAEIAAIAARCATLREFRELHPNVYDIASKRGILRAITRGMDRVTHKFSVDDLMSVAKRYDTYKAFLAEQSSAYHSLWQRGLLDEACAHMQKSGSKYWRKLYRIWNDDNEVYIGLSFNEQSRYQGHIRRPASNMKAFLAKPHRMEAITALMPPDEASHQESETIEAYRSAGWTIMNKNRAGALGGSGRKWTEAMLQQEADRYATRTAMHNGSPGAYDAAIDLGIMDKLFSHHPRCGYASAASEKFGRRKVKRVARGYWTIDRLTAAAAQCQTRREFALRFPGGYDAALKRGVVATIFALHHNQGLRHKQID